MSDEPQNAASVWVKRWVPEFNDPDWVKNVLSTTLAPNFAKADHRRLTAQPDADAEEWIAQQFALCEIAGRWYTGSYEATLAVRGDRLVAFCYHLELGEDALLDFIVVAQLDRNIQQVGLISLYDPEDVDAALTELDHLHTARTLHPRPGGM